MHVCALTRIRVVLGNGRGEQLQVVFSIFSVAHGNAKQGCYQR